MYENNGESSYRRYIKGEKEAFDEIINLYKTGLIGFIFCRIGDMALAEDISEDCFVELIVNPTRYKFKSSLKTYLYGIAHNKTKEHFRQKKSASFVSIEALDEIVSSDNMSSNVEQAENREMINKALLSLPKDYREVLYLLYFDEMSYEEISKIMKKSVKQIYNLAFRGKTMLKKILEKDGFIYEEQ